MKTQKFSAKLIALLIQDQVAKELPLFALQDSKVVELLVKLQRDIQRDLKNIADEQVDIVDLSQDSRLLQAVCKILEVDIIPAFQKISDVIGDETNITTKTKWKSRKKTILKNANAWLAQLKNEATDPFQLFPTLSKKPTLFELIFRNISLFGIGDW
jgi:hypothetical protein